MLTRTASYSDYTEGYCRSRLWCLQDRQEGDNMPGGTQASPSTREGHTQLAQQWFEMPPPARNTVCSDPARVRLEAFSPGATLALGPASSPLPLLLVFRACLLQPRSAAGLPAGCLGRRRPAWSGAAGWAGAAGRQSAWELPGRREPGREEAPASARGVGW